MAATGAWVAFNDDGTGAALFSSELAAFRHGNGKSMVVKPWPFGKTLTEVMGGGEAPVSPGEASSLPADTPPATGKSIRNSSTERES